MRSDLTIISESSDIQDRIFFVQFVKRCGKLFKKQLEWSSDNKYKDGMNKCYEILKEYSIYQKKEEELVNTEDISW